MNLTAVLLLATLLGPERPVAPPAYGPAFGTQYPHALVSDGTDFLALWTGTEGVSATILDEHGATRPVPARALFAGSSVHAAWAGDAYVAVWANGERTMFARISRDAELASAPVAIAAAGLPVAIAASGNNTLVVLAQDAGTTGILVGPNGEILRKDIPIPTATRLYAAAAAASGGGFVVATIETTYAGSPSYAASTVARATRLSASGDLEHSVKLVEVVPNNVNSIDAASDGDRVGIAFVARRNTLNGPQKLYAYTVDARTLAVTTHEPLTVTGDDPRVVPVPGGFAAGMLDYKSTPGVALTTVQFGSSVRESTPLAGVPGADLYMATNGRIVMSVWRDYRFSPPYLYSTMNMFGLALDATASVPESDVQPVAISAVAQAYPAVSSSGATSLVAWLDLTKTVRGNVVVTRVDARGNMLDAPRAIGEDADDFQRPVAVFTGQVWIVAWYVRTSLDGAARMYMRRIGRDGAILDAAPVDLGAGSPVAAASNGTVTLLASGKTLLRFSPAGERLGTIALPDDRYCAALASNGHEFLMAWTEGWDWWQMPSPNLIDIRAIRLDGSGSPMDAAPIDIAMSRANELSPIITSNGTDFLVVYGHRDDGQEWTIRAKRVLRAGVLADHTALDEGSLVGVGEGGYSVAPRDDGYVAAFNHRAGDVFEVQAVTLDVHGAAIEDPVTLGIARYGSTAWTSIDSAVVAYSRTNPSLGNIERVFVRPLGTEMGRRRTIRK